MRRPRQGWRDGMKADKTRERGRGKGMKRTKSAWQHSGHACFAHGFATANITAIRARSSYRSSTIKLSKVRHYGRVSDIQDDCIADYFNYTSVVSAVRDDAIEDEWEACNRTCTCKGLNRGGVWTSPGINRAVSSHHKNVTLRRSRSLCESRWRTHANAFRMLDR